MAQGAKIHPTAIIDPGAELEAGVSVGPYCVIGAGVRIGAGTVIGAHSIIEGAAVIGGNCRIGPSAFVGLQPEHLRFTPDDANPTWVSIGDNVVIREGGRVHRSTKPGRENATRVGDNCFIMAAAHVAHDCILEPHVTLADAVLLGGHSHIGQRAFLGGGCAIHQFVRVGRLSIVAGNEALSQDIPPFAAARYARLKGYNAVGCRRAGFDGRTITALRGAFLCLRTHRTMSTALAAIRSDLPDLPALRELTEFIQTSKRGIVPAYRDPRHPSNAGSTDEHAVTDGN